MTEIIIEPVYNRVLITAPGPQGIPGPAGSPGGSLFVYDRFGIPASSWIIAHGLARRVHVSVISDTGEVVEADILHSDLNNVTITFPSPYSGIAVIG